MSVASYKYNAVDDGMIAWNKQFTSRMGDGSGDAEEAYLSAIQLIAKCKCESTILEIGCGLGRIIKTLKNQVPTIVGLEPDRKRFEECHAQLHNDYSINILNQTSLEYRTENPDARFDFIIVSMVIQHVTTSICKTILDDVYHLLSNTGVAIISTTQQDQERFTYEQNSTPRTIEDFNRYASDCLNQRYGIPVRQFSKQSFIDELHEAKLKVVQWNQFSYIRPEKLNWFADMFGYNAEDHRDVGTSQYAVVCRA